MKHATILFVSIAWASSYVLAKIIFREIEPMTFTAVRYLIAFMVLTLFIRKKIIFEKKLLVVGIFGFALAPLLQFIGLSFTTSIDTTMILSSNPSMAAVLSYILLRERIKMTRILGIILAFVGVSFIVLSNMNLGVFSQERILGDVIVFISGFCWVLSSLYGKMSLKKESALSVTYNSMAVGVPIMLLSAILFEDVGKVLEMSTSSWIFLLIIAVVNTSLAFYLWFKVLERISATEANLFLNTIPIWTAAMAIPLLGETLTLEKIIGAVLVFLGVYFAQRNKNK